MTIVLDHRTLTHFSVLFLFAGVAGEYCDTESFRPECGEGEVIMMTSARYGRMKLAR